MMCKVAALCALSTLAHVWGVETSPVNKVVQLLADLHAKISAQGADADRLHAELTASCRKNAQQLGFDIKTGQAEVAELEANIQEKSANGENLGVRIGDLIAALSVNDADLKAARAIRAKEAADFAAEKGELSDIINTLERAIAIISREMAKGGASMLQLTSATTLAQALSALVQASMFSSADASRLTALVQSSQNSEDEDGPPAGAVYESHSSGILDTLQDLLDKANAQLGDSRAKEVNAKHNFEMLEQSLLDEIKFGEKDLAAARKAAAATSEAKAVAGGDLKVSAADLASDEEALADLKQRCMTAAADHEAASKSRAEELEAIAKAKEVIVSMTGGAETHTYGFSQTSFFQVSSGVDLANFEAVRFVRDLAKKTKAPALSQLASKMAAVIRAGGEGQFDKVKGLISDLIARLESEAGADATEKAFCDKELAETNEKKADKSQDISKLSTKINQMAARSDKLKGQVAGLQKSLSELAAAMAEGSNQRTEEKTLFGDNKAELEKGLAGIKLALKILRDYYSSDGKAHEAAEGAGSGIIGLLEVIESDFTKGLAEITATEDGAAASHDQWEKEAQIERTTKEQDVTYKTKEANDLDKSISEATSDRSGIQTELDAVLGYLQSLEKRCIAKAETYADRAARRAAEIAGLKEALEILESETALLQRKVRHALRGHTA